MKCFVIMPFAPSFDDVYAAVKSAGEGAVPGESVECTRLDEIKKPGRISDDLASEIVGATLCLADLSGSNPNVMWEVGYAMALGKPIVFISQDVSTLPFDIRDMRTIEYDRQSLSGTLRTHVAAAIRDTLGHHQVPRHDTPLKPHIRNIQTIAITGSTGADFERCRSRVPILLGPYLGEAVSWLCGSVGAADEASIEYLIQEKQNVEVVGYHSFDISGKILDIVRSHDIPFLDARKETLPRAIPAPSERDLYFLTKADLQILLWSGHSSDTNELIEWYKGNGKDYVVGFV